MKTYLPIEGMPKCCCHCIKDKSCKLRPKMWEACIRPKNCPVVQMPDVEEAEEILYDLRSKILRGDTHTDVSAIRDALTNLGFKEDK